MTDVVDELASAADALDDADTAIARMGEDDVARVGDRYDEFVDLLSRYRDRATGSGRDVFEAYVEFQRLVAEFVETLPEDLPAREAFERAADVLDRRRLAERDFDRARRELSAAADIASLRSDRTEALERYRSARSAVRARARDVDARIDELESVLAFADVDFDAPTASLRAPITEYNDAVMDAFRSFKERASARSVIDFADTSTAYPLASFRRPPEDLQAYLRQTAAGEERIATLLEYADYSLTKLDHYVDDPNRFRARVAANRSYLEDLDATPLTIQWPPPPAGQLRYRIRELVALVGRFAPDEVTARLRQLRALADDDDYGRLRRAAEARDALSDERLARLQSGDVEEDLRQLEAERERLEDALETYPER